MIYADYSSTSIHKPECVVKAVAETLTEDYGNPSRGAHALALKALEKVDESRQIVAKFFGLPQYWNLGFTPSATYALNLAIKGSVGIGDHVISSFWEHNSVLRPLYQSGAEISFLGKNDKGLVDVDSLPKLLKKNTKALVLNLMSNVTGDILPLDTVADFAKTHQLRLILDASQFGGCFPFDFEHLDNVLLAITGHKSLYGPSGSGALLAKGVPSLVPQNTGGSGIHSFEKTFPDYFPDVCEVGTINLPAIAGLASGVQWLSTQSPHEHLLKLRQTFLKGVENIKHIKHYCASLIGGACMSINIADMPSSTVAQILNDEFDIFTRPGAHCAPLVHETFGTENQGMVRFSFGLSSTLDEVNTCLNAIESIAQKHVG